MATETRPSRSTGTIVLKYLQKAATFSLTNHPHSPRGGAGEKRATARGLSGPIASNVPAGWRKKRSDAGVVDEEPTSPKVTCIGQIKHKKKSSAREAKERQKKKVPSGLSRAFSQRVRPSGEKERKKKPPRPESAASTPAAAAPPALGHMRKFASGRETLSGFDWEKVAADDDSDDEKKAEEHGVEKINIYHSAPLVLGGAGKAEAANLKETKVGLWRRRSMAKPEPLSIK